MKLGVCVPYRNREAHLKEFIPKVSKYLEDNGIDFCIYFGHQIDDKLFNRGAMKNIAAKHAFEDGCDYIVWHDIDMIPEEGCDYSFPTENPIHIATNISQMDYQLKYEEYFGGAVIFSKEQVEKTNGYSNDYWDWGMEDDDLFWRCVLEGYANEQFMSYTEEEQEFVSFNGESSYLKIPTSTRELRNLTKKSHTVSVRVRAHQQEDKVPVWLIGDTERRFCEYPILRRPGYDWGLSYNNSRAYTAQLWDVKQNHLYQWIKRYENRWTQITLSVDTENNKIHFYMNGKESDSRWGTGTHSPLEFDTKLKSYGSMDYYIGTTTSVNLNAIDRWFKGDVSDVKIWNRSLSSEEVSTLSTEHSTEDLVFHLQVQDGLPIDVSGYDVDIEYHNIESGKEQLKFPYTILPHRRPGKLFCLPHKDEGLVNVGGVDKWSKGENTARNERRFVKQMQAGEWDYKSDGFAQVEYDLDSVLELTPKAKMINVRL